MNREASSAQERQPFPPIFEAAEHMRRFPALTVRWNQALVSAVTDSRILGYKHVVRDGQLGNLCAQHPAAGVMCSRCYPKHALRHPDELERQCDECLEIVHPIRPHGVLIPPGWLDVLLPGGLVARDTLGHRRRHQTPLYVACLGTCARCDEATPNVDLADMLNQASDELRGATPEVIFALARDAVGRARDAR